jgi:mono/diheme cytochrome c family protein
MRGQSSIYIFVHLLPAVLLWGMGGCRGDLSADPPVHLNPNMDKQQRYLPQEENTHYRDRRAMRPQVPGTVAVGELDADEHMHRGQVDGKPATSLPTTVKLDRALLERGRGRYDIYCTVCHDGAGTGNGIAVKRGMLPPPSFHEPRIRVMPLGQLFDVISRGARTMPAYGPQVPVRDRWAIVAYIRALQVSRAATIEDIPADVSASKGWSK